MYVIEGKTFENIDFDHSGSKLAMKQVFFDLTREFNHLERTQHGIALLTWHAVRFCLSQSNL